MEPNQNFNMNSYSLSSSSSGNLQNDSKKSEKMHSKKSILRKEGSQSKNKDRHATFVEPSMNQIAFYLPDINNLNKNSRISLNTVSEEPEPNSRSGSELINNRNLSSNRMTVKTEQKLAFDNEINTNSIMKDMNNNNRTYNYLNNNNSSFYNNFNNNYNGKQNLINDDRKNNEVIESKPIIFKNQHSKKPPSRKTLDSDYILKEFPQTNDINFNINNNLQNEAMNNSINQKNTSKVVKITFSNSGRNSLTGESNVNINLEQNKNNNIIKDINNNFVTMNKNQINNSNNSDNSSNERREKREEQTKINTEFNKTLFNINAPRNSLNGININNINNNLNTNINNINVQQNDLINTMSNQINDIISKNNKKPNFKKRITMAITNDDDIYEEHKQNQNIDDKMNNNNNLVKNNDINATDNIFNNNNIFIQNKDKKPKMNKKRITMAGNPFDDDANLFNDNLEQKPIEVVQDMDNSKKLYNNSYNNNEEIPYVEPKIIAQNKNINYDLYEKYLKYNNLSFPKSESKLNNITNLNFPQKDENVSGSGSQTTKKEKQMINSDNLLINLENLNQNKISINPLKTKINIIQNKNQNLNLDSSPLLELINDKSFISKSSENSISNQDEKYNLVLNNDENFDIEKEINNQINFIEKNLEEKEKAWRNKIINNAERHTQFESETNKNKNELSTIERKINEIINQKNELINNKYKYDTLSEKALIINNKLDTAGIEINDIEHLIYKEMNCLLFTVMIKSKLVFKFLISDNIWYEKNLSGDSEVTFIGVLNTEVFSNYFEEETIMNKDKDINLLIQKYYNETINKVFPNEYEKITLHNLSIKYYLAGQISICFLHILKMINHISLIGEEVVFNSQDLKKYFVKFSYYDIFSAKINFIYELNIEKPFSGNCLNSVEVEKNEYILDDFDEYRKNTINIIWKYFNPKDVKINYNYFYNMSLMLNYLDKVKVFKNEFSDEYVFNVMQGNIKPKEIEFESDEMNKFDTLELSQQLDIIYGKQFLEQLVNNNKDIDIDKKEENDNIDNNNKDIDIEKNEDNIGNSKENDDEEIVLDLPPSINEDEN